MYGTKDFGVKKVSSKIMVFTPSWKEFQDFNKYIAYIESQGAYKSGIAKVNN